MKQEARRLKVLKKIPYISSTLQYQDQTVNKALLTIALHFLSINAKTVINSFAVSGADFAHLFIKMFT